MRESFNEYKKTIDSNLVPVEYLYSGDVNSSLNDDFYSETKTTPLTSPSVIINCLKKIYKESFDLVKQRSKEITIPDIPGGLDVGKLTSIMDSVLSYPNRYIFTSKESYKYLGYDKFLTNSTSALPGYFFEITKITGAHSRLYYSPEVEEEDDAYTIYATDHPFQSLVYVLQNMEYEILDDPESINLPINERNWIHKITYKLYDCKFSSVKLLIKNVTRIRDEKIKQILS